MRNVVKQIEEAYKNYAAAVELTQALEDGRQAVKNAAAERIMRGGDNPLTGKPHSFSSADAIVNTDAEYAEYLAKVRAASVARILARGAVDAALAVARVGANE
jgi:hypothetical protein